MLRITSGQWIMGDGLIPQLDNDGPVVIDVTIRHTDIKKPSGSSLSIASVASKKDGKRTNRDPNKDPFLRNFVGKIFRR